MKREKRLTRKQRKQLEGPPATAPTHHGHGHAHHSHIHCIACGKHLDPDVFGEPDGADFLRCQHGQDFPHCVACSEAARALVEAHDANDTPVERAAPWH